MRVAAGVILIVAAVINLFAAIGYLVLGGAGKMTSYVAERSEKQGRELTEEQKESFAQLKQVSGEKGGALLGLGAFLFVTVGTSIAGAVCLFRRKAATFILTAGALAVIAEAIGAVILKATLNVPIGFGKVLTSSMGLLGGILAIVSALQLRAAASASADPPSAVAPM